MFIYLEDIIIHSCSYEYFLCTFFLLNMHTCLSASTTQIDAAKDVIKKLSFSFDSESFENPSEYNLWMCTYNLYVQVAVL